MSLAGAWVLVWVEVDVLCILAWAYSVYRIVTEPDKLIIWSPYTVDDYYEM